MMLPRTLHRNRGWQSGRASSKMQRSDSTSGFTPFQHSGNTMTDSPDTKTHDAGRFLNLVSKDGWEYATRTGSTGVVAITADDHVLLIEQFRPPVDRFVIEIPAGLAGDRCLSIQPRRTAGGRIGSDYHRATLLSRAYDASRKTSESGNCRHNPLRNMERSVNHRLRQDCYCILT